MNPDLKTVEFDAAVAAAVTRFLAQAGLAPLSAEELAAWGETMRALGKEIGWARAGGGGELPEPVVKAGVARLLAALHAPRPELAGLAKQVLKGCCQPDVAACRESYRETDTAGRCRRQEHAYDLTRLSGAHCVDCPHWRGWPAGEHAERLAAAWHDGDGVFAAGRAVFLPEDFRRLRLAANDLS